VFKVVSTVVCPFCLALSFIEPRQRPIHPRIGRRNRIHGNHTYNLIRITAPVELDEGAASRSTFEHVGAGYISRLEQLVKVTNDLTSGSWGGCLTTVPRVGSVIGARHIDLRKMSLQQCRIASRLAISHFEDEGRRARSTALDIEAASVGKIEGALRGLLLLVGGPAVTLIQAAPDHNHCKKS
jgi:hypothetical protein